MKLNQLFAQLRLSVDQASFCLRQAFDSEIVVPNGINAANLEQRLLLSASPLVESVVDVGLSDQSDQLQTVAPTVAQSRSIVFVDAGVEDHDLLISDVESNFQGVTIQLIDSERDGIEQISEFLAQHNNIDSIHILSHGSDGHVRLGSTNLSSLNVNSYAGQIATWGYSLNSGADILFYGCDLASSGDGQELIESIAGLTNADIAASDDLTGHDALGGDWELEYTHGDLTTSLIVSTNFQHNWMQTLETVVVDTAEDYGSADARWGDTSSIAALLSNRGSDGLISFREALAAANVPTGGASDQILFDIDDGAGNQYYYQDNFIAGTVDVANIASVGPGGEALISDFDPDHAYSWFRIDLDNSLPELVIDDDIIIDGFSQWGASSNTLAVGSDAVLRIELTNSAADSKRGFNINSTGAGSTISGLVLNQFGAAAILTDPGADGNTFTGNYIGTDVSGTIDLGNQEGIHLRSGGNMIGGPDSADRNVISGNNSRGVITFTFGPIESGNIVQNNYIGVDSTGLKAIANGGAAGIQIYNQSGMQIIDNVVSGNTNSGIRFLSTDNFSTVIQGNMIGVGADGATLIGNGTDGIYITADATDAVSDTLIGGTGSGQGNTIGGNAGEGIHLSGASSSSITSMSIIGNFIGTNSGLVDTLGNNRSGILIEGATSGITIGGVVAGEANVISNNALNGVTVASGNNIAIRGNRIEQNQLRGIDLVGGIETNGITENDSEDVDSGANDLQNFPVLTSAVVDGADVTINGTINSEPNSNNIIVDLYWSNTADPTGHGEAEFYIGSILVNTDASGNAIINHTFTPDVSVPVGVSVTAAATSPSGSTSEFSMNVISMAAPVLINNQLTLTEGEIVTLDSSNLNASDIDTPDASLVFTVSNVTGGHFAFSSATTTPITSFSKGQVDAGDVMFVHDGNESAPSYDVDVSDGSLVVGPSAGTINFTNVNDAPVISLDPTDLAYALGQIPVDPLLTVSDVDNGQLVGATVEFRAGFLPGEDRLIFTDQLGITGSYNVGTGVLTLTGIASVSDYQTALRSVRYENISATPTFGTLRVRMQVDDGTETSAWERRTIEIIDDQPPRAMDDGGVVAEGGSVIVDLSSNDSDNNNLLDLSSIAIKSGPSFGTLTDNLDGTFTYTHNGSETLSDSFTYTIRDNFGLESNEATVAITVTAVNDAPVVDIIPIAYGVNEDDISRLLSAISVSDADAGANDLQIAISVNDGSIELTTMAGLTVVAGGNGTSDITVEGNLTDLNNALATLQYTPDPDFFGTDLLIVKADDLGNTPGPQLQHQDTANIVVAPINDAPDVSGPLATVLTEDDSAFGLDLLTGASDVESNPLNAIGVTHSSGNDVGITVAGNYLNIDPSAYNYLAAGESEIIVYSYNIVDGFGGVTAQTATITITGINDNPLTGPPLTAASTEDDSAFGINLLAGSNDVDTSDTLDVEGLSLISGNDAGVSILGNTLSVGPSAYNDLAAGEIEVITYNFNVTDGNGGIVSQTAMITIAGVNDDPSVIAAVAASANQNDPTLFVNLLTAANDPDSNDTLSVSGLTLNSGDDSGVTIGVNSLNIDPAAYAYLAVGESAVVQYSYDIVDGNGGVVSQIATITITGVNDDPLAGSAVAAVATEDDPVFALDLLFGSIDPDTTDVISASGLTLTGGDAKGITVVGSSLNVDPTAYNHLAAGESEVITYSYNVDDSNGGLAAQTATITITGVNDQPIFIGPFNVVVTEDAVAQRFDLADLFSDADVTDSLDLTIVSVADAWLDASVDGFDSLWLVPDANQNGLTNVTIQATDSSGAARLATISVEVSPANDTVVVNDQSFATSFGDSVVGTLIGSLTDIDGELLSIIVTDPPANGTLMINPDGTFVFDPDEGFTGDTSFTFVVDDGVSPTDPVVIDIQVFGNVVFIPPDPVDVIPREETEAIEEAIEEAVETSTEISELVNGPDQTNGSVSVDLGTGPDQQQSDFAGPIVVGPANFVNTQVNHNVTFDAAADRVGPSEKLQVMAESFVRQLSGNVNLAALTVINEPGMLWQELDQLRNENSYVTTLDALAVGSVGTVTSSLIVGYVIWALRSGLLLSSIVATMPAWNLLDPLAIIPVADRDSAEGGETLEDIVRTQKSILEGSPNR